MTLKDWLNKQGFPHGMECVGEARLQQLWDAAQNDARDACADRADAELEDSGVALRDAVRDRIMRSNV